MYTESGVKHSMFFAGLLQSLDMLVREVVSVSVVQCPASASADTSLSCDRWHDDQVDTAA